MTLLTIIVATDAGRGIGIDNTLPWKLPEDMARFKRLTTGHPVIMGRKTYDSIGRPLPNRRNIVITRNAAWRADGVEAVHSLDQARALVAAEAEAFIIGGAQVYAEALAVTDQVILTEIGQAFACDAFFPPLGAEWQELERQEHVSANGLPYAFITLRRRPA
ncbi:dihydrofolate reductase [Pseudoduganella namucuonensis]|uniref:Dihydrofolate reductase n=1 Tax=Pseudoduganella namucuonensis TaxID=1035707 RepID=A0A1I7HPA0_9BURK|nr:dihydrofolate reductase [Pseudoduganella namucuonensis]SFU62246.1 dihydrofolate reductase [Pseudoduganella namucuonensis]